MAACNFRGADERRSARRGIGERAVALSKDNPVNTGTLAAAYASAGRFNDAIAQAEKARELAVRRGLRDVAGLLDEMLASYRAGRRFR